jgi:hypothetical protein
MLGSIENKNRSQTPVLASRDRRWESSRSGILKAGLKLIFRLREENPDVKAGPSQQLFSWSQKAQERF